MRSSTVLVSLLLLAATVSAGEQATDWKTALDRLRSRIAEGAAWEQRYRAYKDFKAVYDESDRVQERAYRVVQRDVADGLRRDSVPVSGWLMGLFGAALLWGGLAVCIVIAIRSGKSGVEPD